MPPNRESSLTLARKTAAFPRVALAHLPTPLEEFPRLAAALGVGQLWVKRDDCTGLAMGGSKVRQLEFLLGEAAQRSATVLVAHGSPQSNFVRLVAAAGSRLGLRVVLFLSCEEPNELQGNLLLDACLGAELRFLPQMSAADYVKAAREVSRTLEAQGERCYILPLGGASACGALGYVLGMLELQGQLDQFGIEIDRIVLPVGTGGTLAGLAVAANQHPASAPDLLGISVSETVKMPQKLRMLASQTARLLDLPTDLSVDVPIVADWIGEGYGVPSEVSRDAVRFAARTEGLLLDPIYTGKAMAGLREMLRDGRVPRTTRLVFWHTGGLPSLFADAKHVQVSKYSIRRGQNEIDISHK